MPGYFSYRDPGAARDLGVTHGRNKTHRVWSVALDQMTWLQILALTIYWLGDLEQFPQPLGFLICNMGLQLPAKMEV